MTQDEQRLSEIDAYLVSFPPASINPKVLEWARLIRQHADDLVKRYSPPPPPPPAPPSGDPMASMDAADLNLRADLFWDEVA